MRQEEQITANKSVILCWMIQELKYFISLLHSIHRPTGSMLVAIYHSLCIFSPCFSCSHHSFSQCLCTSMTRFSLHGDKCGEQEWSPCTVLALFRVSIKPFLTLTSFSHFFLYLKDFKRLHHILTPAPHVCILVCTTLADTTFTSYILPQKHPI